MLLRNTREATLLARVFQNSKFLFPTRSRSDDSKEADKIIKLNKENVTYFGKLHETKREKTRRIKLESNGKLPTANPSTVDSELAFILGSTKKNCLIIKKRNNYTIKESQHVKIIHQSPSTTEPQLKNVSKGNLKLNQNLNISSSEINKTNIPINNPISSDKIENDKNSNDAKLIKIDNSSKAEKKNILFPRDYLPNLIEVPVFVKYKCFDELSDSENSEILSISPMEARSCLKYPSVTKILTATMTEEAKKILEKWKQKMIDKLGLKGFETYQEGLFADGKLFHATVMNKLTKQPDEVPDKIKPSLSSLDNVLENIQKVRAVETHTIHPKLMYRGVVDCIASYRGEICLIDWKKSDKPKHTIHDTYDAPLQLASYIGAINADLKYPFMIKKGLIVVAYTNGDPAKIHVINEGTLQMYWKLWLERLTEYHSSLDPA